MPEPSREIFLLALSRGSMMPVGKTAGASWPTALA